MKKLISILLALTFVVSAMASTASAAGEYYMFSFDSGLVNGSGLCGTNRVACITGNYRLTPNNESLDIRAWAVAASGVKEVKYNFNDTEWVVLPETAFAVRDDIYNAATGTYGLAELAQNLTVAPLAPEFSISIPTSELGLVLDSTYMFQIVIVTNAGEEIIIADLMVDYVEYSIDTTPVTPAKRGNCIVSLDNVAAYAGETKIADHGNATTLKYNPGKIDTINFWGWISVDQAAEWATAFGYSVDDGEIVYGTGDWSVTPEDLVVAQPYDYESRFNINADVAGLELGTHTVKAYCQLSNGEQIILKSVTLEITSDRNEVIPGGVLAGIDDGYSAGSFCDFELDHYTEGFNLMQTSGEVGAAHPFRGLWSPKAVLSAGAQVRYETVTDETTGETTVTNKYGAIWGFYSQYSDEKWYGASTFTSDIKIPENSVTTLSRGMFAKFSNEQRVPFDGQNIVPLYEEWCTIDGGYNVAGTSGINVLFPSANTMIVAVLTFNDAAAEGENAKGAIYAIYTLPEELSLDSFRTVEITDDNNGNVFISIEGQVISKVTYADAGMFAHTYDQGYYKTATIWDYNNGGVVAETDKALIAKYNYVGWGTRATEMHFDNYQVTAAKSVTEPEVKEPVIPEPPVVVAPEAITFVEGSKYAINTETGSEVILVKVGTLRSGDDGATFASNIGIDAAFYQIVDGNGAIVDASAISRISRKYSVQLLNADGTVNKTYPIVLLGDADDDGRVRSGDVTTVKLWAKDRISTPDIEGVIGDMNGDGRIRSADATTLKLYIKNGSF